MCAPKLSQSPGIDGSIPSESLDHDSTAPWEEFTPYLGVHPMIAVLPQSTWERWLREDSRAKIPVPKHACLLLALKDAPVGCDRLIPLIQQWAQSHQICLIHIQDNETSARRIGLVLLRFLDAEVVPGNTFVDFEDFRVILGADKPNTVVHYCMAVATVEHGVETALILALSQLGISNITPIETVFPHASGILIACAVARMSDKRSRLFEHCATVCRLLKKSCSYAPEIQLLCVPLLDDDLYDEVRVTVLLTDVIPSDDPKRPFSPRSKWHSPD